MIHSSNMLSILGRVKNSSTLLVSYPEEQLIRRIILGCQNFVFKMEDIRYERHFKSYKISQRQRIQLSVVYPSISKPYTKKGFRPFPTVKDKLEGIEIIDKALVYNKLKKLINVNYLEKITYSKSKFSPTNTKYFESDYLGSLKELVSRTIPRTIIYYKLLESNILIRYLTVLIYSELLMTKHIDVNEVIKGKKARGLRDLDLQDDTDKFKKRYTESQKFLQDKTNREILFNAEILAKEQIQNKRLDDPTYTRFFIAGGISYGEIENSPYEK
jgi:hypothetical protein